MLETSLQANWIYIDTWYTIRIPISPRELVRIETFCHNIRSSVSSKESQTHTILFVTEYRRTVYTQIWDKSRVFLAYAIPTSNTVPARNQRRHLSMIVQRRNTSTQSVWNYYELLRIGPAILIDSRQNRQAIENDLRDSKTICIVKEPLSPTKIKYSDLSH